VGGPTHADVVLVANQFNPTILSEHWLVTHGIAPQSADERQLVQLPGFVALKTAEFALEARADKVQLTLAEPPTRDATKTAGDVIGAIAGNLPETPYVAMGFNLWWAGFSKNPDEFVTRSRDMFLKSDSPFAPFFDTSDARFGAYYSNAFDAFRMRLVVRPIKPDDPALQPLEGLLYQFNFHADLADGNAVASILDLLGRWELVWDESARVFTSTAGWLKDELQPTG